MSNKPYNNLTFIYESVLGAAKSFIGKTIRTDYIILSEGIDAYFDLSISDIQKAKDLAEEVVVTIEELGANHIRVYEPESDDTLFETACFPGGINELNYLLNNGILECEGVPAYFKDFIFLKTELITKINEEKAVIVKLYNSRNDADVHTPFNDEKTNDRVVSSLFAAQEMMQEKVNETIFTNEEYKALLADDCLSWYISDLHSGNGEILGTADLFNNFYITMAECFYSAAQELIETSEPFDDSSPINK